MLGVYTVVQVNSDSFRLFQSILKSKLMEMSCPNEAPKFTDAALHSKVSPSKVLKGKTAAVE